jgi:hypothetical protein
MEKIYLVVSSRGDYEDFREKVERAFRNKKEAQMYCIEVDKSHEYEEVYEEVVWNDILNDFDKIMEKEEDKFTNNIPYELNSEDWLKREDEILNLMYEELLSILHKRGLTDATIEDVKKQMEYDNHKYDAYHKCRIKEIELY